MRGFAVLAILFTFSFLLSTLPSEILTDGNELHLGRDDPLSRIPELRDGMAGAGAEGLAFCALEVVEAILALGLAGEFFVAAREVAVVLRFDLAAFVLGDVPSPTDPFLA